MSRKRGAVFWLDFSFGVLWPGFLLVPLLVTYCIYFPLQVFFLMMQGVVSNTLETYLEVGRLLLLGLAGLIPLLVLATLVWNGTEEVRRRPKLRVLFLFFGLVGLVLGGFFFLVYLGGWANLFRRGVPIYPFSISAWLALLFDDGRFVSFGLIGPLAVGSSQFFLLWKKQE